MRDSLEDVKIIYEIVCRFTGTQMEDKKSPCKTPVLSKALCTYIACNHFKIRMRYLIEFFGIGRRTLERSKLKVFNGLRFKDKHYAVYYDIMKAIDDKAECG